MASSTPISSQIVANFQNLDPNVKNGLMVLLVSSSIFLYYWRRSSSSPSGSKSSGRRYAGRPGRRLGRNDGRAYRKREIEDKEFAERVERLNLQRLQSLAEKERYGSLKSWEKFEYIFDNNVIAEIIPLVEGFAKTYGPAELKTEQVEDGQVEDEQDPEEKAERCQQQHAFLTEKILMTLFKFDDIDIEPEIKAQRRLEIKTRRKEIIREIQGYNKQIDEIFQIYK